MTIRVVLACDGQEGVFPCRQAIPVGAVAELRDGRLYAQTQGWTASHRAEGVFHDLCPACTRREMEGRR